MLKKLALLLAFSGAASASTIKETTTNTDIQFYLAPSGVVTKEAAIDGTLGYFKTNNITNLAGTGAPTFPFGATGITASISDFSIQSVSSGGTAVLNGGYLRLPDGRELATYSGSGSTSSSYGVNLSLSLGTIITQSGGTQAAATYYLYIDLAGLAIPAVTSDTGRALVAITSANLNMQALAPSAVNQARFIPIGFAQSTSGSAWSTSSFGTSATKISSPPGTNASPTLYTLTKQAIGTVGTAGQIAGGQIMTAATFPITAGASELSYWNLKTSTSDNSGNGRTLGVTVSACNTAAIGLQADGSFNCPLGSGNFQSQSAYYNTASATASRSVGSWIFFPTWPVTATTGLFLVQFSGTDDSWELNALTGGTLRLSTETTAGGGTGFNGTMTTSSLGWSSGSWHHVVFTFDGSKVYLYGDGRLLASQAQSNLRQTTGSAIFFVNNTQAGAITNLNYREMFFDNATAFTAEDIRKIYSYRFDHNTSTSIDRQNWRANWYRTDNNVASQLDPAWMVSQNSNSLWADFSPYLSTESIDLRMQDMGVSAISVPTKTYDTGFLTAAPTFPITHGLSEAPTVLTVMYEVSAGVFDSLTSDSYCSVSATQITCDLTPLTIGTNNRVRIIASVLPAALSLAPAFIQSGSAASPGAGFIANPSTGFFNTAGVLGFSTAGVQAGQVDTSQQWTVGPAAPAGNTSHVLQGGGGTSNDMSVQLLAKGTTNSATLQITNSANKTGQIAIAGRANTPVTGAASGDLAILAPSTNTLFSGDGGTTIHGSMTNAGAWTFGAAAGTATHTFNVGGSGNFFKVASGTGGRPGVVMNRSAASFALGLHTGGQPIIAYAGQTLAFFVDTYANVIDPTNLGGEGTGTNVGQVDTTGSWTFGTQAFSGHHTIYSSTAATNDAALFIYQAASGSNTDAGLFVSKKSTGTSSANPFVLFEVNNSAGTTPGAGTGSGMIAANGANAAAFASFSDYRLKTNIEDLPSQLSNIMALKPREFDYKAGGHQIGFVAQEMQKVYPDAVSTADNGYLLIGGWSKTDARLVKVIQEQQVMIEQLKARLDAAGL